VTATQAPQLTLVKTPDPATVHQADDEVTYTFPRPTPATSPASQSARAASRALAALSALTYAGPSPAILAPGDANGVHRDLHPHPSRRVRRHHHQLIR